MCGIIWVKRKDSAKARKVLHKRFEAQRSRGVQGFGFMEIEKGNVKKWYQMRYEAEMETALNQATAPEILFHHRLPTSTPNFPEATHPIRVSNELLKYDYYVVHNGVISNDETMKARHEELGFEYTTIIQHQFQTKHALYDGVVEFNDSEAFAIDIALAIDKDKTTIESEGSIAFMCLQVEKETNNVKNLFFGRNYRNPLIVEDTKDFIVISSVGKGAEVKPNYLHRFNYETGKCEEVKYLSFGKYVYETPKIGFHYSGDDKKEKQGSLIPQTIVSKTDVAPKELAERTQAYYDGERIKYTNKELDEMQADDFGEIDFLASFTDSLGNTMRFETLDEIMEAMEEAESDLKEAEEDLATAKKRQGNHEGVIYWQEWVDGLRKDYNRLKTLFYDIGVLQPTEDHADKF